MSNNETVETPKRWQCFVKTCAGACWRQAIVGVQCLNHKGTDFVCSLPPPHEVDLYFASGPCQPFTVMRRGQGRDAIPSEHHRGYDATFGNDYSILGVLRRVLPHVFCSEQVYGFGQEPKDGSPSPKDTFIQMVMGIERVPGTAHFDAATCLSIDSTVFVEGSRGRCPVCVS